MNNPISDLYVKFMETIEPYIKKYPYLFGIIIGGIDFSNLSIQINEAKIMYGNFIQTIIDFLIIAICIFTVIRTFEKIKNN